MSTLILLDYVNKLFYKHQQTYTKGQPQTPLGDHIHTALRNAPQIALLVKKHLFIRKTFFSSGAVEKCVYGNI